MLPALLLVIRLDVSWAAESQKIPPIGGPSLDKNRRKLAGSFVHTDLAALENNHFEDSKAFFG